MQQEEPRSELRKLFRQPYDSEKWKRMLIDFFGATEMRREARVLTSEHDEKVTGYELGKLRLPGFDIGLYEFEIRGYRIGLNRVGLRSLVKSYTAYDVEAALVVYYDDRQWRLSYICNLRDGKTAPKRFTYLFGNPDETYRTPVDRFLLLRNKGVTPENIYEAFSVEKLNADFFNGYKAQFRKFCAYIGGREKWQRDYVKKLLGRLVFLQFLQKKGWMGVPSEARGWTGGDANYMRTLLDRHKGNDRLLAEVLELLFFETLNRKREDDLADPLLGDRIRIPYLNGGLFDRDALDRNRIDFPYAYFDELIEFFAQYNFTIDENDPDDSEVGIDPEMLGHIFENLLEDNKDKGTFYTPKEIVQYMSRESLIQYLRTHTDEAVHAAVGRLIRTGEVDPALQNPKVAARLDTLLREVKVCDPAIGSGAFPMGVLGEIFKCRRVLYGFTKRREAFSPSKVKREIIQKNIYGVDIEQGAVDIARLRFWLSLVVDEEEPQPLPNLDYKIMQGNSLLESFEGIDLSRFAVQPEADGLLFGSPADAQTRRALGPLIGQHFSVTDHAEKEGIRGEIDAIIRSHIGNALDLRERELLAEEAQHMRAVKENREFIDNPSTAAGNRRKYEKNLKSEEAKLKRTQEKLEKVGASRVHIGHLDRTNCPFFLWHTYFKDVFDRGGFDIVIANPPYRILTKNNTDNSELFCYIKDYESIKNSYSKNLFTLFIELGITKLLKKGAIIAYIIPEGLFKTRSYEGCTGVMSMYGNTLITVTFTDYVFENAVTGSLIFVYRKQHDDSITKKYHFDSNYHLKEIVETHNPILSKVSSGATPLAELTTIFKGMVVKNRSQCIFSEKRNLPDIFLLGKNISKWVVKSQNHTDYKNLSIIGGTKKLSKHQQVPRILIRRTGDALCCAFLEVPALTESTLYSCWSTTTNVSNRYLISLLNSRLLDYYNHQLFITNQQGFPQILMSDLELLPIKIAENQQPFIALVDRILEAKRENPAADTSALEAEIDRMVYDLYGLTPAEVDVVEGRTPPAERPDENNRGKKFDFFISHASEDKQDIVRPLAEALKAAGCRVWYDESELKLGDSLRRKIDHGLANSRYGIVVISRNFMKKNWPDYELNGMVAREIDGVKVVLPLWHGVTKKEVAAYSSSLADKLALDTSEVGIPEIVGKLKELLAEPVPEE